MWRYGSIKKLPFAVARYIYPAFENISEIQKILKEVLKIPENYLKCLQWHSFSFPFFFTEVIILHNIVKFKLYNVIC